MFRIGLKAFVKYDGKGKLVPSSLVLLDKKPDVGTWVEIPMRLSSFTKPLPKTSYNRGFVRYDVRGDVVPGSLKLSRSVPSIGNWLEIDMSLSCHMCTTTTTTTIGNR